MDFSRWHLKATLDDGTIVYAEFDRTGTANARESGELAADELYANDAILPILHTFKESQVEDLPGGKWRFVGEYPDFVAAELKKAKDFEATLPEDGVHVGNTLQIGVADGYAHYVVTEVKETTCVIEWRNFGGDRYRAAILEWGGEFPIDRILPYVNADRRWRKMVARQSGS